MLCIHYRGVFFECLNTSRAYESFVNTARLTVQDITTVYTHQAATVVTESRREVRLFLEVMHETLSKSLAVGFHEIVLHFFFTDHPITKNGYDGMSVLVRTSFRLHCVDIKRIIDQLKVDVGKLNAAELRSF